MPVCLLQYLLHVVPRPKPNRFPIHGTCHRSRTKRNGIRHGRTFRCDHCPKRRSHWQTVFWGQSKIRIRLDFPAFRVVGVEGELLLKRKPSCRFTDRGRSPISRKPPPDPANATVCRDSVMDYGKAVVGLQKEKHDVSLFERAKRSCRDDLEHDYVRQTVAVVPGSCLAGISPLGIFLF